MFYELLLIQNKIILKFIFLKEYIFSYLRYKYYNLYFLM